MVRLGLTCNGKVHLTRLNQDQYFLTTRSQSLVVEMEVDVFPVVHRDTSLNITGHETLYEFSVTAVSETCSFLARSLSSDLAHSTTKVQGTAIHLAYNMHIDGFKLQTLIIIT